LTECDGCHARAAVVGSCAVQSGYDVLCTLPGRGHAESLNAKCLLLRTLAHRRLPTVIEQHLRPGTRLRSSFGSCSKTLFDGRATNASGSAFIYYRQVCRLRHRLSVLSLYGDVGPRPPAL